MNNKSSFTLFRRLSLSGSRQSIVLLLLICFFNTILFPAICYPTHHYKKIDFSQTYTGSFTDYLASAYINQDAPVSENPEEDANEVFSATEDIDLIAHFNTTSVASLSTPIELNFIISNSCIINTFLSNSTPPPEYLV